MKRLIPERLRAQVRPGSRLDNLLDHHPVALLLVVAAIMFIVPLALVGVQYHRTNQGIAKTAELARTTASIARTNSDTLAQIQDERDDRLITVAGVQKFICQENNKQDLILGSLLDLSLRQGRDRHLTERQKEALVVFQQAAADLNDTPNCDRLVAIYLAGTGLDPKDVKPPHVGG